MGDEDRVRIAALVMGGVLGFAVGAGWMETRMAALFKSDFERLDEMLSTDICDELADRRLASEIFARGGSLDGSPEEIEAHRRELARFCMDLFSPSISGN
ncbi:MAG: hypothetical protein ABL308_05855 [Oceanicaulis sp.]